MPKYCMLILLDGLGDRSFKVLGGKTPLQAAKTPNLDQLSALGINGLLHAGRRGVPLPSENAHFAIFGYAKEEFPGRGYLEAIGAGMSPEPDDICILAHFASVRKAGRNLTLQLDKPKFTPEEIAALLEETASFEAEGIEISFTHTKRHEGILTLSGKVSPFITDTDPFVKGRQLIEPLPLAHATENADAQRTARVLKKYLLWCYRKFSSHPVNKKRIQEGKLPINAVATQRPGRFKKVPPFSDRWGLKGLSISSGIVYWGLCRFIGMDVLEAGDTGDIASDFKERMTDAMERLSDYDFIHVHTKAPDTAAHEAGPVEKKNVIEAIDLGLGSIIDQLLHDPELLVIVTSDHSTPSESVMIHSGEPVPIAITGRGVRRDNVKRFNEIECAGGALGFVNARDLMYIVLNHLDRAKLRGAMDTPEDQPYWPGPFKPFTVE